MKTIKKIVLKNTLGITEQTIEPSQINIIVGRKGSGKTSVLDAINTSLSNQKIRTEFIKRGELEASMYIELTDGTVIDRTKSLLKSDKIIVKDNEVQNSPESYLRGLFNSNQFRPISFIEATLKEQNKILLSMVKIEWTMDNIKKWFGEIPEGVNYSNHILNILDEIQSKRGHYFLTREDINRDIKSKKAVVADIIKNVPEKYQADKWRNIQLSDMYGQLTKAQENNKKIDDAQTEISNFSIKKNAIISQFENRNLTLEKDFADYKTGKQSQKQKIELEINRLKQEYSNIDIEIANKFEQIENQKKSNNELQKLEIEQLQQQTEQFKNLNLDKIDTQDLQSKAEYAEKMKAFLHEYDSAMQIQKETETLFEKSETLTAKIEIARQLPATLLQFVQTPIEGLSVKDGVPLINGLPVQNLSSGEQLELAVKIAIQLAGDLGVILVDKLESLDERSQKLFIEACQKTNLQYFMTKVSDVEYNIIKL